MGVVRLSFFGGVGVCPVQRAACSTQSPSHPPPLPARYLYLSPEDYQALADAGTAAGQGPPVKAHRIEGPGGEARYQLTGALRCAVPCMMCMLCCAALR